MESTASEVRAPAAASNRLSGSSIVASAVSRSAAEGVEVDTSDLEQPEPAGGWAVDRLVSDAGRPAGSLDAELARSSDLMVQLIHLQMEEMNMVEDVRSNIEKVKHDTKKNTVSNVR
jgi:hypothetical protein